MLQATPGARPGLQYLDWFHTMRQTQPVWRDPSTGYWNVFRYDDAVAVMHDFHTYSSQRPGAGMFEGDIINMDPPRHDQLRGIVSQVFTPRAIAQLEPRIRAITEELLAQTEGRSELELIDDLAFPLPVTVIAEMLGVPAADRPLFRQWSDELHRMTDVDMTSEASRDEAVQLMGRFQNYLRDHVRDRRNRPRNDLLSGLVSAELDGQRLSDDEIVGFATILLIAGHVTTTSALANAMLCLDEHREAQRALRADPAKLPVAIEEVLRYRSPVGRVERMATQDTSLHGNEVTRGEEVHVWLQSANRDSSVFPNADEFIVDRQPNRHLAFATGIHFCLGAP
ncbi:MAG: cytochrome P450, partial [Chloroflexi bacterium]|nr:cytochrome P450 [Chloroflexota bacterium]